ncbi:hypothetical protein EGR_09536 [Echinococcus granulosus]|uniref:Uncharacterized protein n=1 Tax=Echinococcus granulosus TaxID=6210 RepID=W6U4V7_ECHGR|nr:hypothetical protein EGR_09536 [Echinococcus granulosus]EUB55596.1 hypothetical protein EGR_09536 [Echinococcus granulosus]
MATGGYDDEKEKVEKEGPVESVKQRKELSKLNEYSEYHVMMLGPLSPLLSFLLCKIVKCCWIAEMYHEALLEGDRDEPKTHSNTTLETFNLNYEMSILCRIKF